MKKSDRLPDMLTECVQCLLTAKRQTWEVIVVDDGSRDGTNEIPANVAQKLLPPGDKRLKCLTLHRNRGKVCNFFYCFFFQIRKMKKKIIFSIPKKSKLFEPGPRSKNGHDGGVGREDLLCRC